MKKIILLVLTAIIYLPLEAKDLKNCEWKNDEGTPCLTIFSTPNTSDINESSLNKVVITKKKMIDSGYEDVRSVLEYVTGLDVFANGPTGQGASIFMRGMNSNHTLVLMNGIPINDPGAPKGQFDFGYDFLQGL